MDKLQRAFQRQRLAGSLQGLGLVCLSVAGAMVTLALGVAIAGVGLIVWGLAVERDR